MKIYQSPEIHFKNVNLLNIVTTSDPIIVDEEADPNNPALIPQRGLGIGDDWETFFN